MGVKTDLISTADSDDKLLPFYDVNPRSKGQHHYLLTSDARRAHGCTTCKGPCSVDRQVRADVFVSGFPCRPFSKNNLKRFRPDSWRQHSEIQPFYDTIDELLHENHFTALLENVEGFACKNIVQDEEAPSSELDHRLDSSGKFAHISLKCDHKYWIQNERPRFWHACEFALQGLIICCLFVFKLIDRWLERPPWVVDTLF